VIYLTDRARQFVEYAVTKFGDADQRGIWNDWARAHPVVVVTKSALPRVVAQAALDALIAYGRSMDQRIEAGADDDDTISDLENDLSFVEAISRDMRMELR